MLSFRHASRRNTKCYQIRLGGDSFYLSYETIIAAEVHDGDEYRRVRLDNSWGPTTGRHMNELEVRNYAVIEESEMQRLVRQSILRAGQQVALDKPN
jgi:hypothetical protein